jgi:hypothetical protein
MEKYAYAILLLTLILHHNKIGQRITIHIISNTQFYMANINTADLKVKLQELDRIIQDAENKKESIKYVLETFTDSENTSTLFAIQENQQSFEKPLYLKDGILKVLREAGRPLNRKDISKRLDFLGLKSTKNSFAGSLYILKRNNKIKSPEVGMYTII